jgi:2-dehydro-3-deoxyphosphogluconate aldolase/(4S)-4-hydroxy-2-oxoglutarate aldolase
MAKYDRLATYTAILDCGLVPLFYHDSPEVACGIATACASGGAKVLEFTNRGDNALRVFSELINAVSKNSSLILGVGSICDPATAALYIAHGANFIVGPMFDPEVSRLCNRCRIPYIPGCGTVTEISSAEESGVEIVKIFPGDTLGPGFIKAVHGPMPRSRLMPTGGVDATEESVNEWISAGAACLGLGSKLISKEFMAQKNYTGIEELTGTMITWIHNARSKKK